MCLLEAYVTTTSNDPPTDPLVFSVDPAYEPCFQESLVNFPLFTKNLEGKSSFRAPEGTPCPAR